MIDHEVCNNDLWLADSMYGRVVISGLCRNVNK